MKVLAVAPECYPLIKTGGLADVASALPVRLHRAGHDVRLFFPFYSAIDRAGREFSTVDFIRDVPVQLGPTSYTFSAVTTRLPGSDSPTCPSGCARSSCRMEAEQDRRVGR